MELAYYDPRH